VYLYAKGEILQKYQNMDELTIGKVKQVIDQQINKIDKLLDKRSSAGQHFDDFIAEEKARLYGMLEIYWLLGGTDYQHFKR
jgi:hypothetical protein